MKNHFIVSFFVGVLISIAAIYFAFRYVPLSNLWLYLKSINYVWTIPAVFMVMVGFFLRTLRWQYILESSHKIGIWQAFHPLMIGFMINCILPGRLGEFAIVGQSALREPSNPQWPAPGIFRWPQLSAHRQGKWMCPLHCAGFRLPV